MSRDLKKRKDVAASGRTLQAKGMSWARFLWRVGIKLSIRGENMEIEGP